MKKVKNIFHKIANADPMIWGYVMLNDRLKKNLINAEKAFVNNQKKRLFLVNDRFFPF